MDRELKFRGKHIHVFSKNKKLDGQWVYGYYCDENYIRTDNAEKLIDKNTLGQFTGVNDTDVCYLGELDIDIDTFIEVIGNVYDNPELLES